MTQETFSNLILDSESTLYRVAMSMLRNEKDCEDAVQTAVLTAFEKLGTARTPCKRLSSPPLKSLAH